MGELRRNQNEKTPEDEGSGNRLRWAGHLQRMSEERLTKRLGKTEEGSRRRRGTLKLRWRDMVLRTGLGPIM